MTIDSAVRSGSRLAIYLLCFVLTPKINQSSFKQFIVFIYVRLICHRRIFQELGVNCTMRVLNKKEIRRRLLLSSIKQTILWFQVVVSAVGVKKPTRWKVRCTFRAAVLIIKEFFNAFSWSWLSWLVTELQSRNYLFLQLWRHKFLSMLNSAEELDSSNHT